jgi:hypothetical protein
MKFRLCDVAGAGLVAGYVEADVDLKQQLAGGLAAHGLKG